MTDLAYPKTFCSVCGQAEVGAKQPAPCKPGKKHQRLEVTSPTCPHGKPAARPGGRSIWRCAGCWPGETPEDRLYRQRRLREYGCRPYPMPFRRTPELVGFQRWCISSCDKRVPWDVWVAAKYQPRNLPR